MDGKEMEEFKLDSNKLLSVKEDEIPSILKKKDYLTRMDYLQDRLDDGDSFGWDQTGDWDENEDRIRRQLDTENVRKRDKAARGYLLEYQKEKLKDLKKKQRWSRKKVKRKIGKVKFVDEARFPVVLSEALEFLYSSLPIEEKRHDFLKGLSKEIVDGWDGDIEEFIDAVQRIIVVKWYIKEKKDIYTGGGFWEGKSDVEREDVLRDHSKVKEWLKHSRDGMIKDLEDMVREFRISIGGEWDTIEKKLIILTRNTKDYIATLMGLLEEDILKLLSFKDVEEGLDGLLVGEVEKGEWLPGFEPSIDPDGEKSYFKPAYTDKNGVYREAEVIAKGKRNWHGGKRRTRKKVRKKGTKKKARRTKKKARRRTKKKTRRRRTRNNYFSTI